MDHLVKVRDADGRHAMAVVLDDTQARRPAADFVLDVIGAASPTALPEGVSLTPDQQPAFEALQRLIFDRDQEGLVVRDGVHFLANGRELDPDTPLTVCFAPMAADGQRYLRCEIVVAAETEPQEARIQEYAGLALLHMLAVGRHLDVTKDHPGLSETLGRLERDGLIAIDVPRASYALSEAGKARHEAMVREAQELVKRYDIYGDVDEDPSGTVRFDTGLGQDWRVAVFELEGLDPFRSRFLIGLNDGEWDQLPDWTLRLQDPVWYDEVFAGVESAPGVQDVGVPRLERAIAAGKARLRDDDLFRWGR